MYKMFCFVFRTLDDQENESTNKSSICLEYLLNYNYIIRQIISKYMCRLRIMLKHSAF